MNVGESRTTELTWPAFAPARDPSGLESSSAHISRLVVALGVIGALVRVALASFVGLSVDESYAVVMSRTLALSYYDHPPLLFWIPGMAAWLAGSEHALVVRLPFILMFAATTWLVYRLGAELFGAHAGQWSAVALNLTFFFTLSAASWVLPDGPLLLFGAGAALCLVQATRRGNAWSGWIGFGLFSGLALLSKYHGVFLLAGAALFVATDASQRHWLRRPQPYVALALAVLVFSPVLVWNAQHEWASFRFQGSRAIPLEPERDFPLLGMVAGQIGWLLPWMWIPLVAVLVSALRRGPRDPSRWLLACLAVGPIATFAVCAALGRRGLPHWSAPGYFMLLPLLGAAIADRLARGDVWTRRWLWVASGGLAATLLLLVSQTTTGWIERRAPALLARGDPTIDFVPWESVAERVRALGYPRAGVEIAGGLWADCAKLAYALGPDVPVACVSGDPRGFEYARSQAGLVGRDVLLVVARRSGMREPMFSYAPYFGRMTPLETVPVRRGGHDDVAVSLYLGARFLQPLPPTTRPR